MATHFSILDRRIPWAEEPGGPQSIGLQRIGHNLVTEQQSEQRVSLVAQMVKNPPNAEDVVSTSGLGRFPGEGNDNPLQYSCLENSMDRGAGGLQSLGPHRVEHD